MYTELAHLYDWPGSLAFAEASLEKTLAVFKTGNVPEGAVVLDLACGTGSLSLELAQMGYAVFGIDLSEAMLLEARRKARETGVAVEFLQADMRDFALTPTADVVLCYYDSLNHLPDEASLAATFRCVRNALKPGGLFLFDLNTLETFQELWQGKDVYEGPNYRMTIQSAFDRTLNQGTAHFSAMEHTEDGLVCREEEVRERYFPDETVEKLLREAGFTAIAQEGFTPFENTELTFPLKTLWQCR